MKHLLSTRNCDQYCKREHNSEEDPNFILKGRKPIKGVLTGKDHTIRQQVTRAIRNLLYMVTQKKDPLGE